MPPWPRRILEASLRAALGSPYLAVLLVWGALMLPFAGTRSLYYEEGRYTLAALDMLANGHWLRPEVLGLDFVEKPPALFWLIAAAVDLVGAPTEWAVRAPSAVATLAGALLAAAAARRAAGSAAGLVAALAFLLSPFIFTKGVRAEPDLFVTVGCFAAYLLWLATRGPKVPRALLGGIAAALILAASGLFKGPQPLAYFGVAAGFVAVAERRWRELPALLVIGAVAVGSSLAWAALIQQPGDALVWQAQMRLTERPTAGSYLFGMLRFAGEAAAELLPWLLLALPAMLPAWRRRHGLGDGLPRAMTFYALGCTAILAFWPGALARYAMPALPAVAVLAGIGWAGLWRTASPDRRRALAALLLLVAVVRIVWLGAIPFETKRNEASRRLAAELTAPLAGSTDPLLLIGPAIDYNAAFYMRRSGLDPRQIRALGEISPPAWLIAAGRPPPGATEVVAAADRKGLVYRLYRIEEPD